MCIRDSIKGGKMFGALENYKSQSFYKEHKTIQFDTLTERGEYEIVAVFKTVAYNSQSFRYRCRHGRKIAPSRRSDSNLPSACELWLFYGCIILAVAENVNMHRAF